MGIQLTALAACLQTLFTTSAERLGHSTGFIRRQRQLTAPQFAQTLVFQWVAKSTTTVDTLARHLELSPEGLRQRLGPAAQQFLAALLTEALSHAWQARRQPLGLLDRFTAVVVEDTSVVPLPAALADQFPGCGGTAGAGTAALKLHLRWDLHTGQVYHLSVHAGRTSDKTLAAAPAELPAGSLHLADQGFFDSRRWQQFGPGQYWVSRVPAGTKVCAHGVWQGLGALLAGERSAVVDREVLLVERTGLPCRLVALRCPPAVAARRREQLRARTGRKKGRAPSAEQLARCDWTVLATNVPDTMLAAKELWRVYRCRWQVELLFKRAKGLLGWGFSWGTTADRVLTEYLAKLLGLVVTHWATLLRGGPLAGVSPTKRFEAVAEVAPLLRVALRRGADAVADALRELVAQLNHIRPQAKSRKKPSTRQLMLEPRLAP